jgi:hypothetical protein
MYGSAEDDIGTKPHEEIEIDPSITTTECCPKPTSRTLGFAILGFSILFLLLSITYTIYTIGAAANPINNGEVFAAISVFSTLFLITSCVGIASGIPKVAQRKQFVCTIITLVGQLLFLVSIILITIIVAAVPRYHGSVESLYVNISVGIAAGLVTPAIGVTIARIVVFKRERLSFAHLDFERLV